MSEQHPADMLYGLEAIGRYLGITARQAEHLAAKEMVPTFKMGRTVCSLRSDIETHLRAQAQAARRPQVSTGE